MVAIMLYVEVVGGDDAGVVARELRDRDAEGLVSVAVSSIAVDVPVGFRIAAPSVQGDDAVRSVVDVRFSPAETIGQQVERLWLHRLEPWAAALAGRPVESYPAVILNYDPQWPCAARRRLTHIQRVLTAVDPEDEFTYEHIGSTSVAGLGAKAVIDLQVRVPRIPGPVVLDTAMRQVGYLAARGSRPDSPGVYRDTPRGTEVVPDEVWVKRLFYSPDPVLPSIVHIRRADSPWGLHTLWFRDWLRANPEQRDRYQRRKLQIAAEHTGDADYDDYTRAKSRFFDEVHQSFETWAARRNSSDVDSDSGRFRPRC